jgi:hypothetical protein
MAIRYEMSNQERWVRRALMGTGKYDLLANDSLVLKHVTESMTAGSIAQVVEQMGERGTLAVSPTWQKPFDAFFEANPRFLNGPANQGILERAWQASGTMLTAPNIAMVAEAPEVWDNLAVKPEVEAAEREHRLAAELAQRKLEAAAEFRTAMYGWHEELQQNLFAKHRINTFERDRSLRDEKRRLDAMDYEALATEYTNRKEVRRARAMDAKDYRAEVAISRAASEQPVAQPKMQQALASQYEHMPLEWTPRGSLTPITLDRKMLIHIANTDRELFRSLVRRFGADSVNDRLAGRN